MRRPAATYQRTLSATLEGWTTSPPACEPGAIGRARRTSGLPASGRRRAPGLRREEVARLAGLSVDYLSRLEQGRASAPSPSVLAPLARALRLSDDERDHLFRLAGQAPPGAGRIDRRITPGVQRVLDRLHDVPVMVVDAAWQIVAMNDRSRALLGDDERNVLRRHFAGEPSRVIRTPEQVAQMESAAVADLHARGRPLPERRAAARADRRPAGDQPALRRALGAAPVARHISDRKTIEHPEIGRVTVDCDELTVAGWTSG